MRDVKAGPLNAGRDINIYDQSNQTKLLADLNTGELFEERQYRKALLSKERKRKIKILAVTWVTASLVAGGFGLKYYFDGYDQLPYLIFLGSQFLLAFASIKIFEQPTPFEERQIVALQEITCLLREKGGY